MSETELYRKSKLQPMAPWKPGTDMTGVSVSEADAANGSPQEGDMIAHNPDCPDDRWLVAAEFFRDNYERADQPHFAVPDEWREAVQEFVDRCERGEVRSRYTYAKFKSLLAAHQEEGGSGKCASCGSPTNGARFCSGHCQETYHGLS